MIGFGPGSRNNKIGTIYQRMKGLLKSGAISESERPLWYDIWEAFPPAVPPVLDRPTPDVEVKPILYPEDIVRAKFGLTYQRPISHLRSEKPFKQNKMEMFVNEYMVQQSNYDTVNGAIKAVVDALEEKHIYFDNRAKRNLEPDEVDEVDPDKVFRKLQSRKRTTQRPEPEGPVDFSDLFDTNLDDLEQPAKESIVHHEVTETDVKTKEFVGKEKETKIPLKTEHLETTFEVKRSVEKEVDTGDKSIELAKLTEEARKKKLAQKERKKEELEAKAERAKQEKSENAKEMAMLKHLADQHVPKAKDVDSLIDEMIDSQYLGKINLDNDSIQLDESSSKEGDKKSEGKRRRKGPRK